MYINKIIYAKLVFIYDLTIVLAREKALKSVKLKSKHFIKNIMWNVYTYYIYIYTYI